MQVGTLSPRPERSSPACSSAIAFPENAHRENTDDSTPHRLGLFQIYLSVSQQNSPPRWYLAKNVTSSNEKWRGEMTVASGDHLRLLDQVAESVLVVALPPHRRAMPAPRRPRRFRHRPPQPRLHRPAGHAPHDIAGRTLLEAYPGLRVRRRPGRPRGKGAGRRRPAVRAGPGRPAHRRRRADPVPVIDLRAARYDGGVVFTWRGASATRAAWARRSSTGAPGWRWRRPATCWPTANSGPPRARARVPAAARDHALWREPGGRRGVDISVRWRPPSRASW